MASLSRFMDTLKETGWDIGISVVSLQLCLTDNKYREALTHNPTPVFSNVHSFRGRKNRVMHDLTADVYRVEALTSLYSLSNNQLVYKGKGRIVAYFLYGPNSFLPKQGTNGYGVLLDHSTGPRTFATYLDAARTNGPIARKAQLQKELLLSKDNHEYAIKAASTASELADKTLVEVIDNYAHSLGVDPQTIKANLPALQTVADALLSAKSPELNTESHYQALTGIQQTLTILEGIESLNDLDTVS